MASQSELDAVYMGTAMLHARLSRSRRSKVGAVLVTSKGVTLTGYNGSAKGMDNNLEIENPDGTLTTKINTLHSELNCILKAAKEGVSVEDSTMYLTLSPCTHCSTMMIQVGVQKVVYKDVYRDDSGLQLLKDHGVVVEQYKVKEQK